MDFDEHSLNSAPTMLAGRHAVLPNSDYPARIDQYALVRKLGGGGFGVVYLALDTVSGVEVALKTLHPLLKGNAEEMVRLREKFALVSRLTHTNIAKALVLHPVRDVVIPDESVRHELRLFPGDSVMVMDYAPGVTLSKWRKQFPDGIVPLPLVIKIARQIASALDYAHGEKIVHRDIKPANVMVETLEQGETPQSRSQTGGGVRVRLLDFGLAAEIRSSMSRVSSEQGDTSGTRPYMAPEQWVGKKQDGKTDQYALACVLYELISGEPPFAGAFETGDPIIMMSAVKNEEPDEIDDVPPSVNEALHHALAKNPKERFDSCSVFVKALEGQEGADAPEGRDLQSHDTFPASKGVETAVGGRGGDSAALEADVLRRKVALARSLKDVSASERADAAFSRFITDAEIESTAANEAIDRNRFAAAAQCLSRAEAALEGLRKATEESRAREEAERSAREEAERRKKEEELQLLVQGPEPGTTETIALMPEVEMDFCWCPATTSEFWKALSGGKDYFLMGSPETEDGRLSDETLHSVTLTRGFWMGRTPVTQWQWEAIMRDNPSTFIDDRNWLGFGGKTAPDNPVETVTWFECQKYVEKLNAMRCNPIPDMVFALPTEAQWEYACRAGTTGPYGCTGFLKDMGWYDDNSDGRTHPVATKKSNAWGFYDMHGNVHEWCQDLYGKYPDAAVADPKGAPTGSDRVYRGGSWYSNARYCRSARRGRNFESSAYNNIGFRIALVPAK